LPGAFSFFNEKKIVIYKAKVRKEFTGVPGRIIHIDLEGRPMVACKQGGILLLQTDVEISLNFKIGNDFQNNL
jgi:methionyl-tRNA formyltransferase